MSGRGGSGRGAFLRSLQESTTDDSSKEESGLGRSQSVGRGRFLLGTDDSDNTPSSNTPSHDGSSLSHGTSGIDISNVPKPTSGRGKLLQLLLEEKTKNISDDVSFEETIASVAEDFEEVIIEAPEIEQEPVIRRGTKGWCIVFCSSSSSSSYFGYNVKVLPFWLDKIFVFVDLTMSLPLVIVMASIFVILLLELLTTGKFCQRGVTHWSIWCDTYSKRT